MGNALTPRRMARITCHLTWRARISALSILDDAHGVRGRPRAGCTMEYPTPQGHHGCHPFVPPLRVHASAPHAHEYIS